MNSLEKALVNNPIRSLMLRRLASALLGRAGVSLIGKSVLEIGCGQGAGTESLLQSCGADEVVAFDFDWAQLARAKRRHRARLGRDLALFQGDAARLPFGNGRFDVVVEFAILHHVPEWPLAIREIARVLKPGGALLFEEFLKGFTAHAVTQRFLIHPKEGMFGAEQFYGELAEAGLILRTPQRRLRQWWIAGVAENRA